MLQYTRTFFRRHFFRLKGMVSNLKPPFLLLLHLCMLVMYPWMTFFYLTGLFLVYLEKKFEAARSSLEAEEMVELSSKT